MQDVEGHRGKFRALEEQASHLSEPRATDLATQLTQQYAALQSHSDVSSLHFNVMCHYFFLIKFSNKCTCDERVKYNNRGLLNSKK